MPELRQLRYFLAVAEELNFTRVAIRLHIAPQAMSAAIRQLEKELQAPLFARTTRKVELTPAGQALVEPARRTLEAAAAAVEMVRATARGERGHLHVGLTSGAAADLPHRIFRAFQRRLPEAQLDFHYFTWTDSSVGLRSGATHVAFVRPPITGDLELLPLFAEPRVAVLPPATRWPAGVTCRSASCWRRPGACCRPTIPSGGTSGWPASIVAAGRPGPGR